MKRLTNIILTLLLVAFTTQLAASEKSKSAKAPMILEFDTSITPNDIYVQVNIPLYGEVDAVIDWGDGYTTDVNEPGTYTHMLPKDQIRQVTITGDVEIFGPLIHMRDEALYRLTKVISYGDIGLKTLSKTFANSLSPPRVT